jgi:hypothetical protein
MNAPEEGGLTPAPNTPVSDEAKLRELVLEQYAADDQPDYKEMPIPGRSPLVARYHREVEWDVQERARKAIQSGKGDLLDALIDLMIAACEEILVRRASGELVPLSTVFPELGDASARYTPQVAKLFKPEMEIDTARAAVMQIFPNAQAIAPHAGRLDAWISYAEETAEAEDFSTG